MMTTHRTTRCYAGLASGLAVAVLAVGGCSSTSPGSRSHDTRIPDKPSGTLNILVGSATGSDAGFKAVNAAFHKKYPGVKVNFTSVPVENFPAVRTSRLSAGSVDVTLANPVVVPNYVPKSDEGDDARIAQSGGFVDLTGEPFMKNYSKSLLDGVRFEGKNYTVPLGVSYYTGMYYNKALFQRAGVSIPTTWDEFVSACKALKAKGIVPIGIGGKDTAGLHPYAVVQSLYPSTQDKRDLVESLWKRKTKLNQGVPLEVLQRVQTMYDYAQPNWAGFNSSTEIADFAHGKFAMMLDGTWNETTIAQAGGSSLQFGYFPLPASDNAANNKALGGKVEIALAVPSNGKNVPAALAWVNFFSQPANYQLFLKDAGFASAQPNTAISPFFKSIGQYTSTYEEAWATIWVQNPKSGPASSVPFNALGIKPIGTGDVQGAADASEKDWEAGF